MNKKCAKNKIDLKHFSVTDENPGNKSARIANVYLNIGHNFFLPKKQEPWNVA